MLWIAMWWISMLPPLSDIALLPPREEISHACFCLGERLAVLRMRRFVDLRRWQEIDEEIADIRILENIWHTALVAVCKSHDSHYQREALERLRLLVGEDYRLPPYGAVWRFQRKE